MKKIIVKIALLALAIAPLSTAFYAGATALPNWNVTGNYVLALNYLGTPYAHDASLSQDSSGNLTGSGGSPAGSNVYTWVITSGSVSGNTINFDANYTATADAVTPLTVMHVAGTIAPDGTMSGTWSDNYQGGNRTGTWTTTSGNAVLPGTLAAQDFGVVNYDTGLGTLKGYTAGFGLTDATFDTTSSIIVRLYSGTALLQTNTATAKVGTLTGAKTISSPFDVSGNFDYTTDGYWTNVRAAEYGQSLAATRVVATVTLANGKVVTAENDNLTGDSTTIYPMVTTNPATNASTTDATLNGKNGASDATGHSFWVSLNTFSTASPTIPANVYSTADLGAIASNTPFSAPLSSATGLPAVTPNTTYYFAAWTLVGGTWYPGQILTLKTANSQGGSSNTGEIDGNVLPGNGTLKIDSITVTKATSTADGTFAGGWKYVFHITEPNSESKLAMKFADWTSGANLIPVANNMRISSAQADNSGATILLTAANTYSSPSLNMVTDLDPVAPGRQVDVTVEVSIPTTTVAGSYATVYGVQTTP